MIDVSNLFMFEEDGFVLYKEEYYEMYVPKKHITTIYIGCGQWVGPEGGGG